MTLLGTSSLHTRAGAFDATRRTPSSQANSKAGWNPNPEPSRSQVLKDLKKQRWYKTTDAAVTETLSPELKAKIKKVKRYTKNVRSKQELMSKIGHETTNRFGEVTLHLPMHKVFTTRFKNPKRLPEDVREALSHAIIEAVAGRRTAIERTGISPLKVRTPGPTSEPIDSAGSTGFGGPSGRTAHAW